MTETDPREAFVETVGTIAQTDGLPRVAGRLLALLIWEGDAIAFGDLARQLGVSRGSVSTSMRLLEERGLVLRTSRPGARGDYFVLTPDPFATMISGYAQRTARHAAQIETAVERAPDDGTRARVGAYAEFYRTLTRSLDEAAGTLRARTRGETT